MNIYDRLIKILKEKNREEPLLFGSSLLSVDDDKIPRMLFRNYRLTSDGPKGLRLTDEAQYIFSHYFDSYSITIDDNIERSLYVLYLDKMTSMPWYMNISVVTLYEKDLAMKMKLAGDMETLMETFKNG